MSDLNESPVRRDLAQMTGRRIDIVDPVRFYASPVFQELIENPVHDVPLASTTPSVLNLTRIVFNNTSATTVTNFLNGQDGQELIVIGDNNTTLQNNSNIGIKRGSNIVLESGKAYHFVFIDGKWREIGGAGTTSASSVLGSNQSISTPGTYVDAVTVSLTAGTWLLNGHISFSQTSASPIKYIARIRENGGPTNYASTETMSVGAKPSYASLSVTCIITLASTTTIRLQGTASAASTIQAATADYSSGNTATILTAVRLG